MGERGLPGTLDDRPVGERVEYVAVSDKDALAAFKLCTRLEGIIPALEPSHAIHHAGVIARELGPGGRILVCLSGRGDKDMDSIPTKSEAEAVTSRGPLDVDEG